MKLEFIINENYLIVDTLSNMDPSRFSSNKCKKAIVAFQNLAWKESKKCYHLLIGRLSPHELVNNSIRSIVRELPKFFIELKKSNQYKKILFQTRKYLTFCKNQWNKNNENTNKIIQELTGFKLNKTFTIYITHPSLKNGRYWGNNKISWGHNEDWPNYITIYLWHEILHSYFQNTDLDHALIRFITDEELRIRLNRGKYPPFIGHENLFPLMNKILPFWKEYLKLKKKDIIEFREMLRKLKIEAKSKSL